MRAFLIDPAARSITALDFQGGDNPDAIYPIIGARSFDIGTLARCGNTRAVAFVDDEGLLKSNACFRFEGYHHPLAGKALILGCNEHGATVECPLTLEQVTSRVQWVDQALALAKVRADQAISAADYRSPWFQGRDRADRPRERHHASGACVMRTITLPRVRATYSVLKSQAMPPIVWIVDHDGARSITNDADAVCKAVHAEHPGHRIIYRDTAGFWDELVHDEGVFLTFAPARDLAPQERA